ncbi:uncharacterized protein LOC125369538 [Ricinus communis]|uniref:uncharacterized protein LOC125369538 n=1 Tax=Ricinus communis TaxID=3988 RepID=UPI00201A7BF0|nr:uncharacterized protein LOC125369538 [Ricinus communis]
MPSLCIPVEASSKVKEPERQKVKPFPVKEYQPKIPYPARLKQMPKYTKFLKDILSSKSKLEEVAYVKLNEECSVVFQSKLPEKHHDLGSFTIPCTLGNLCVDDALANLGASINVMATSMFNKLGLGEAKPIRLCVQLADHSVKLLRGIVENEQGASINVMPTSMFNKLSLEEAKPTRMCIQLANHSFKLPRGILENVLVKVDNFIFPMDFVVMDMDNKHGVPLILGRPFLATAGAKKDIFEGKLELNVGDGCVTFSLFPFYSSPANHVHAICAIDWIGLACDKPP